ncbi:UDP-glucose/GDP-mannose dehydrogenase family protein [Ammoniphilus sp. CFH 90114]|uniref:UDP-glucose dehydrogenase family protein n=1 Tax=Ammoniphilus sp. CFH 90114 TaxID=2493665 RepID=UPI00100F833A|nr:UDP-glucose/GDP-mannose dehydrogenase family protein [Ammoniphilus sp. CFH 90114]RXT13973.1 UDP-glucose/GDP-mannose dehydrogenase family protein [Ammoniphilus sp. CFH 90114]
MKIAVIGTGYVGITTAASLGELGHQVIGVDIDREKISKLSKGILPIYEPGVEELIQEQLRDKTLFFTTDISEAVKESEIIFIAVGTPSLPNGQPNMTYVEDVAKELGKSIGEYKIVVNKSTVPVGTADRVKELIISEIRQRKLQVAVDVISNPEFLQEGKALQDARKPDRIVIGSDSEVAKEKMCKLYEKVDAPLFITTPRNAEMIKYASNAFLATKISYINEIAKLCDLLRVDVTDVAKGMGLDKRIGPHFLQAGVGYGGSCFPKDVAALYSMGKNAKMEMSILRQVQEVNNSQPEWLLEQMSNKLKGFHGKRVALLGLAFKPDTDDIREAPSLKLIPLLLQAGAFVIAYDPIVHSKIKDRFPDIILAKTAYQAIKNTDAILLCTEWKEFLYLDWLKVKEEMKGQHVFDARNVLPQKELESYGFLYWGVGRNSSAN